MMNTFPPCIVLSHPLELDLITKERGQIFLLVHIELCGEGKSRKESRDNQGKFEANLPFCPFFFFL